MTTRDKIRAELDAKPWQECNELKAIIKPENERSFESGFSNMYATGQLQRREVRRSITNTPVYAYANNPEWRKGKHKPKKESPATTRVAPEPTPVAQVTGLDALVESFASQLAESIANAMVPKLVSALRPRIEEGLAKALPALAAPVGEVVPPPPKETRLIKPRVAVVGLLPAQAGHIQQEFGQVLDMEFPERGDPRALKSAALQCDRIFGLTKFIPHSAEDNLANAGARYRRVAGGMSDLRHALMCYVKGEGK